MLLLLSWLIWKPARQHTPCQCIQIELTQGYRFNLLGMLDDFGWIGVRSTFYRWSPFFDASLCVATIFRATGFLWHSFLVSLFLAPEPLAQLLSTELCSMPLLWCRYFQVATFKSLLPIRYFDAAMLAASDFRANLTVTDLISMDTLAGSSRYLRFRTNGTASFRSTDLTRSAAASRLLARRDQANNLVA